MDKVLDPNICGWDVAQYLIFSGNVFGNFVYYSHLFPALSILLLAVIALLFNPHGLPNRILFGIAVAFSFWSFFDLILWATERTDYTMFFWSALVPFELLLYVLTFYFVFAFLYKKMPNWKVDLTVLLLFLPIALFGHTSLALEAFDFTNCWREAIEGPLITLYLYNVEILITLAICGIGVHALYHSSREYRRQILLCVGGVLLFLFMFSAGNILGSLETDWELGQIGLFGMPIMIGFLMYLIVHYASFRVRLMAPEAIVAILFILNISLLFVPRISNVRIIAGATTLMVVVMGYLLIKSVRNEAKQLHKIEQLAKNLEKANARLKVLDQMKSEFVSIASHQLRSPLTSIRGYASMILEGSYGKIPQKAQEAIERIADSSAFMASSVEDYLNVSRIQAGNMKYEYSDFNIKDKIEKIVDDLRREAVRKGLLLTFKSELHSQAIVHADLGKTQQIIHNLINNSLKYTPQGQVQVFIHDQQKPKKIFIDIIDTGIGMSHETIEKLFGKFERAQNANNVNATGTGLGLFIAKKMAEDMGGTVSAHSEGEGHGSTFRLELPLQQ